MVWWTLWMGCGKIQIDQQAWRMDAKEEQVLFASAEEFWLGMRWGEMTRVGKYIDDPLARARFVSNYQTGQYMETKVLHVELVDQGELDTSQNIWKYGTVYIQVEKLVDGYSLQRMEETQQWKRTANGWYVVIE